MIEEIINVKIFWNREENESVLFATAKLQQDLLNKGYRIAGDTLTKEQIKERKK